MDKPFGVWSDELCCFVRLCDITASPLGNGAFRETVLMYGHADAAVAAMPLIASLSGLDVHRCEALAISEDDRPESRDHIPLRSFADIDRFKAAVGSRTRNV